MSNDLKSAIFLFCCNTAPLFSFFPVAHRERAVNSTTGLFNPRAHFSFGVYNAGLSEPTKPHVNVQNSPNHQGLFLQYDSSIIIIDQPNMVRNTHKTRSWAKLQSPMPNTRLTNFSCNLWGLTEIRNGFVLCVFSPTVFQGQFWLQVQVRLLVGSYETRSCRASGAGARCTTHRSCSCLFCGETRVLSPPRGP
jgi:hypothetical protein